MLGGRALRTFAATLGRLARTHRGALAKRRGTRDSAWLGHTNVAIQTFFRQQIDFRLQLVFRI